MVNQLAYVISAPVLLAFSVQFYKSIIFNKNLSAICFFLAIVISCATKVGLFFLYNSGDVWNTLLYFTSLNFLEKFFMLFGLFYLLKLKVSFKITFCVFSIIYSWLLIGWWLGISTWNFRGLLAMFNASFYIFLVIFLVKFKHLLPQKIIKPAMYILSIYTVFWLSLYPVMAKFPIWKTVAIYSEITLCISMYAIFFVAFNDKVKCDSAV